MRKARELVLAAVVSHVLEMTWGVVSSIAGALQQHACMQQ
jgi:hypothetical protein